MNEQELIQVEFSNGAERKIVWVDANWRFKIGDNVTFYDDFKAKIEIDDDEELPIWRVEKVYETRMLVSQIYRKWGLDLPKSQRTER